MDIISKANSMPYPAENSTLKLSGKVKVYPPRIIAWYGLSSTYMSSEEKEKTNQVVAIGYLALGEQCVHGTERARESPGFEVNNHTISC